MIAELNAYWKDIRELEDFPKERPKREPRVNNFDADTYDYEEPPAKKQKKVHEKVKLK